MIGLTAVTPVFAALQQGRQRAPSAAANVKVMPSAAAGPHAGLRLARSPVAVATKLTPETTGWQGIVRDGDGGGRRRWRIREKITAFAQEVAFAFHLE